MKFKNNAFDNFIKTNLEFQKFLSQVQKNDYCFWLVGGCLRDFLLDLPQTDIDIVCSDDPTDFARSFSSTVSGHWFWLDSHRKQSRVLLDSGMSFDFAPLRAPTILQDLELRDFTINSLALNLKSFMHDLELLDPLSGRIHLQQKLLHRCSHKSFKDDPLRMIKGIRHAATLDLSLSEETQQEITLLNDLIVGIAGERIRDELGKVFDSEGVIAGITLLIDTGLFVSLFGPADPHWDQGAVLRDIESLKKKIKQIEVNAGERFLKVSSKEQFSLKAIFLFACFVYYYSPKQLSHLLHERLRLSRNFQSLLEELLVEPDQNIFTFMATIKGKRRQALVVEQLGKYACEKMFYWGVCHDRLELDIALELQESFNAEQAFGHIPGLLRGQMIVDIMNISPGKQISHIQLELKQAEIKGEIVTSEDAENWLKNELLFDNKVT